jgi:hypothetical protein
MPITYHKQVKSHHFKEDGTARFKYTVDPDTGRWIPNEPDLLDWEIITVETPDPPMVKFMEGLKKVLWTILKGVLFIVAYGTVRGHIHAKKNKR